MTKPIYRLSSIARPLETQYPSNLAVVILLPLIGVALFALAFFYRETGLTAAATSGISGLLAAFLAWALGRELDPDRNAAAFVAMALTVAAIALGWSPALWTLALSLMATRIVVRTVGPAARATDLALVTGLGAMAVFSDGYWAMGIVTAAAMLIDHHLDRSRRINLAFAAIAVALSLVAAAGRGGDLAALLQPLNTIDPGWSLAALILTAVSAVMILTCPAVTSVCDASAAPVEKRRVRAGGVVVVLLASASLLEGQAGLLAALPVWAALAGMVEARAMPKRKLS